jgi:hypothetical protein
MGILKLFTEKRKLKVVREKGLRNKTQYKRKESEVFRN